MMSRNHGCTVAYAALLAAFLLTLFSPQAHADTYAILGFTDYSGAGPVLSIDVYGDVLFANFNCDGVPGGDLGCYSVYHLSGSITDTAQLPVLNLGTDVPCTPVSGATPSLCDNGYVAYDTGGAIYGGPIGDVQELTSLADLAGDHLLLNQYGDIAWTDGAIEENFLAYDITAHETPEPATITLMITGLAAALTRRKRRQ